MKIPKSGDDLKNEIIKSSDLYKHIGDLRERQLIKMLKDIPDFIIIEGIIQVFELNRLDLLWTDQNICARILTEINPKTEYKFTVLLKRVLKHWNKSIEELPF